jgi:hypothetical protein
MDHKAGARQTLVTTGNQKLWRQCQAAAPSFRLAGTVIVATMAISQQIDVLLCIRARTSNYWQQITHLVTFISWCTLPLSGTQV